LLSRFSLGLRNGLLPKREDKRGEREDSWQTGVQTTRAQAMRVIFPSGEIEAFGDDGYSWNPASQEE
jgi:hypothetical protein